MQDLSWQYVDIIKADIEGMWWEFCNELLNKNIDFKILITEFELNFVKVYHRWFLENYFHPFDNIYEFGCGTGFNLVVASEIFPNKNL